MRRLVILEIFNILFLPLLFNVLTLIYLPDRYSAQNQDSSSPTPLGNNEPARMFVDIIANSEEQMLRFLLQSIMVVVLF